MLKIGVGVFLIGVIVVILSLTLVPSSSLLLAGLIFAGAGFLLMRLFRNG